MVSKKKVWPPVVEIIETGERFVSLSDAARRIGGSPQGVHDTLRGKQKTYMGFTFKDLRNRSENALR